MLAAILGRTVSSYQAISGESLRELRAGSDVQRGPKLLQRLFLKLPGVVNGRLLTSLS